MTFKIEQADFYAKEIEKNIDAIIARSSEAGRKLWALINTEHPVQIGIVLNNTSNECVLKILDALDEKTAYQIFYRLSRSVQTYLLQQVDNARVAYFCHKLPSDELIDILETIPDKNLEKYINLSGKKRQDKILTSLSADEKSAGRILNSDILGVYEGFTIKKVISLLQQYDRRTEILPRLYVVNTDFKLSGYIDIADLLKHDSSTKLISFLKPIDVKVNVSDRQEKVAHLIRDYNLLSVPVTDDVNTFLGIITANDVIDVIEEEATEESYQLSGAGGITEEYSNTRFFEIVFQRCKWLIPLLLLQSISGFIMDYFEATLVKFGVFSFMTMLVGTGGNVGNQSSTFFVRGLATGEINRKNKQSMFFRELLVSVAIGITLMLVSIGRAAYVTNKIPSILAVAISLFLIIVVSVFLGSIIPIFLHSRKIDPANSAAPFLSTMMDIIGVTICCLVCHVLLK